MLKLRVTASLGNIYQLGLNGKNGGLYDMVYLMKESDFTAKDMIDTIIHYRITYLPEHILQLIKAKKEDPYDIEGIEKPKMNMITYEDLKGYIIEEVENKRKSRKNLE